MAGAQPLERLIIRRQGTLTVDELKHIQREFTGFIRCSTTCVGYDADASTPSPPAQIYPELRPVSLPNELTLHILQYLDEPYKLQGRLTFVRKASSYPMIIFYNPRLWASMPTFQICKVTRSQAIKRYGQPSQYSLPFDGTVDSFSLQEDVFEHMSMLDKYISTPPNDPSLPGHIPHITASGSIFYCKLDKPSATEPAPAKQLSLDLQERIQSMEIEIGDYTIFSLDDQERVVDFLSAKFTTLHTVKLKMNRHDTCGLATDGIEGNIYKLYDYNTGIMFVLWMSFFDSLAVLEVEKIKARCRTQTKNDDDGYLHD
ncbi:hypothetical protein F4680DRAFT_466179 [Xylaria scruposa]|nr:hypothetical protein F4680DRAFT_466179 [Xylaria scruposa]